MKLNASAGHMYILGGPKKGKLIIKASSIEKMNCFLISKRLKGEPRMPRKKAAPKNSESKKGNISSNDPGRPSQKDFDAYIASVKKKGMLGDIHRKIDFVKTGSWVINRLIGNGDHNDSPGGIPRGFMTEICGDESTGKTTLALHIAQQALSEGDVVVYADFEQSLRLQLNYVKNIGLDTTSRNFIHLVPNSLQEGVQEIGRSLVMVRPAVVIIDSVAAMLPKETLDKEADEITQIGRHAKQVGSFINWISKKLQKYNCALVLINQFRSNIKGQYDPGPTLITTGGKALQYFIGLRIRLKKTSNKEEVTEKSVITGVAEKKRISQEVKVIIEKNKLDIPWKSGPMYIVFGWGIDNLMSLITLGVNLKVIKKNAGYLKWDDPNGKHSFNVNGKLALKKFFIENPDALNAVQSYLTLSRDDSEMNTTLEELETLGVDNLTDDQKDQLKEIRKIKGLPIDDLELSSDQKDDLAELEGFGGDEDE
jgi:recombination protein RecA